MKTVTLLATVLTALLLATMAQAEPPQPDLTEYAFEDTNVDGALRTPLGEILPVRRGGERTSLVRARSQFVVELLRSVEDLPAH